MLELTVREVKAQTHSVCLTTSTPT